MEKIIKYLRESIDKAYAIKGKVNTDTPSFKQWREGLRAVYKRLGKEYLDGFEKTRFFPVAFVPGCDESVFIDACSRGIDSAIAYTEAIITELEMFGPASKTSNTRNDSLNGHSTNINIVQTQVQSQKIANDIDYGNYDVETRRAIEMLIAELNRDKKNNGKIREIIMWLADKSIDALIALLVH